LFNRDRRNTAATLSNHRLAISIKGQGTTEPRSGTYSFDRGARIYVSALPSSGWRFDGWSGDISGSHSPHIFSMNSDQRIIANFLPVHTLTISTTGHGTTEPRSGTYSYDRGTRIYVSALPESGWKLDQWSGDISGRDSTRILTINSDKNITACFQPQYRFNKPVTSAISYIANRNSREIHSSDCYWVTKMNETNKIPLYDFGDIFGMIKNRGYNGCFYCLRRYDKDTLTSDLVLRNLEADLNGTQ